MHYLCHFFRISDDFGFFDCRLDTFFEYPTIPAERFVNQRNVIQETPGHRIVEI